MAYAQEENQIRGFERISSEYRRKTLWLATLWGIFWPLMQVHARIAATVVLWLGGRQVLAGAMTLGEYAAFNGYLAMLTWPLMAIGYTANQYQRGTASLSRMARAISVYERVPDVDRRREGEALLGIAWCYCRSHDLDRARFYAGLAARAGAEMRELRAALSGSCGASQD